MNIKRLWVCVWLWRLLFSLSLWLFSLWVMHGVTTWPIPSFISLSHQSLSSSFALFLLLLLRLPFPSKRTDGRLIKWADGQDWGWGEGDYESQKEERKRPQTCFFFVHVCCCIFSRWCHDYFNWNFDTNNKMMMKKEKDCFPLLVLKGSSCFFPSTPTYYRIQKLFIRFNYLLGERRNWILRRHDGRDIGRPWHLFFFFSPSFFFFFLFVVWLHS